MLGIRRALAAILLCGVSVAHATAKPATVKWDNGWYKAIFTTFFPPQISGLPAANGTVMVYKSKTDISGQEYADVFTPVDAKLAAALTANTTHNPFHALFPALYTVTSAKKRAQCTVLGVPFELDDTTTTREWLLGFSALQCLNADASAALRGGDTEPHHWVLQQNAQGKYRVLMESDGEVQISNRHKEQGYKEIRTRVLVKRLPDNDLQCGSAELTWHYRRDRYVLAERAYFAQDCQALYFPELSGDDWQRAYADYEAQVKTLIDAWLENLGK